MASVGVHYFFLFLTVILGVVKRGGEEEAAEALIVKSYMFRLRTVTWRDSCIIIVLTGYLAPLLRRITSTCRVLLFFSFSCEVIYSFDKIEKVHFVILNVIKQY